MMHKINQWQRRIYRQISWLNAKMYKHFSSYLCIEDSQSTCSTSMVFRPRSTDALYENLGSQFAFVRILVFA